MKNIDYDLEIIGEKKTYKPRREFIDPILNSKNKIFEITADNSYGKTFFLNLLAYGLEADKLDDDRILKSIKDLVSRYDDQSSYNLGYNIELSLPDKRKLSLTKEKGRDKIIQIDEGAPIGYKVLHKDLSIIYDVPTNPSERLNAVIKDLGNWNTNLTQKFKKVYRLFFDISMEFDNVRNEEKILKLRDKCEILGKELEELNSKIAKDREFINELNKFQNIQNLSSLFIKVNDLETKTLKKDSEFKLLKKPTKVDKKDTNKIKELHGELSSIEGDFKNIILKFIRHINNENEILELISADKSIEKQYEFIKETELKDIFSSDDYVRLQNKFIESIEYLQDTINRFIIDKKNDKSYVIHNSYTQFIELLEELMENEIDHLLQTATTLDSRKLKKQLEDLIENYKIKNYDSFRFFLNKDMKPLKGLMAQYMRVQIQLTKESSKKLASDDSKYYRTKAELDSLKSSLNQLKSRFSIANASCATDFNISDLSKLNSLSKITDLKYCQEKKINNSELLDNINSSIEDLKRKIGKLELKGQDLVGEKKMTEKSLEIEEARKESRFNEDQKRKINTFIKMLGRISVNLKQYDDLITKIETGHLDNFKHENDISFIELAGKIIAYSMDNKLLRAEGEFVDLNFYDMRKQEFHCGDNLIIKKDDVSTGLASANYLKQRIDNVEGKYVVVLLDEIGNMAQNALDKVIESIKKLEDQNRLVIAVFTRPNSNGIEILEY